MRHRCGNCSDEHVVCFRCIEFGQAFGPLWFGLVWFIWINMLRQMRRVFWTLTWTIQREKKQVVWKSINCVLALVSLFALFPTHSPALCMCNISNKRAFFAVIVIVTVWPFAWVAIVNIVRVTVFWRCPLLLTIYTEKNTFNPHIFCRPPICSVHFTCARFSALNSIFASYNTYFIFSIKLFTL